MWELSPPDDRSHQSISIIAEVPNDDYVCAYAKKESQKFLFPLKNLWTILVTCYFPLHRLNVGNWTSIVYGDTCRRCSKMLRTWINYWILRLSPGSRAEGGPTHSIPSYSSLSVCAGWNGCAKQDLGVAKPIKEKKVSLLRLCLHLRSGGCRSCSQIRTQKSLE